MAAAVINGVSRVLPVTNERGINTALSYQTCVMPVEILTETRDCQLHRAESQQSLS